MTALSTDALRVNLRQARLAAGLTAAEVAQKAGVSRDVIVNYENRGNFDLLSRIIAVCGVLGMGLDEACTPSGCDTCFGRPPLGFRCNMCGAPS